MMTRGEVTSLLDLCMDTSLLLLESASFKTQQIFIPEDLCEAFISKRLKSGDCNDNFLSSFSNPQTSRVVRVNLKGASITDRGLEHISCQPIRELNISSCTGVTQNGLKFLHRCKNTLTCLNLCQCSHIYEFADVGYFNNLKILDVKKTQITQEQFECIAQGLYNLVFLNLSETAIVDLSPLEYLRNLSTLDLSECRELTSIAPIGCLKGSLSRLIMYNCVGLKDFHEPVKTIGQLQMLQYLDVSKDRREYDMDMEPPYIDSKMFSTLSSLPNLIYLDMSGTAIFKKEDLSFFHPPHPRLQFLGLCITDVCYYPDIPADVVTGEAGENQIMASLLHYINRPRFLINAMRELFNLVRNNLQQMESNTICDLVLNAMRSNMADHKIQIAGSASLYHLSRDELENQAQEKCVTEKQRREIVLITLDSMENHIAEEQLQKNCCLTLCNFRIPAEVEFAYKRVARVLLKSAVNHRTDFIQRIAIGLCNLLVCQVQDDQKVTVGRDLGGVKMVLQVMRQKLDSPRPEHGGVLECCWSALWNVTDETPDNCSLFIGNGGMDLFLECKMKLGEQRDLLRNMLGLMGNVSEVGFLRPHLMKCAGVFYDLLDSTNELEVSYNAAGILCHMAFDGPAVWTCSRVTREMAMVKLVNCIEQWDIGASRQMSYRSFAPILRLLRKYDTPAIQHWGTWALANLCNVDAEKYCALIIAEEGIPLLEEIMKNPDVPARIREYTQIVLKKCVPFLEMKSSASSS